MGSANPITPSKVTAAPGRNKSANQHWDFISSWYSISHNSNHSDNGWYLVRTSLCQIPFCFQWIMSLNLPNWGWLIFPCYGRRNRGTQSSSNLPKVTQMVQWNSTCHFHFQQLNWPPGWKGPPLPLAWTPQKGGQIIAHRPSPICCPFLYLYTGD